MAYPTRKPIEQRAEIEDLKEQNQALLSMLMDLTARIEALEQ